MRPCTPYTIYVAHNTIWEGNYFYCGGLLRNSFHGIIHHFFYSKNFSPDYCPNHLKLLHRIIQFYHRGLVENELHERGTCVFLDLFIQLLITTLH